MAFSPLSFSKYIFESCLDAENLNNGSFIPSVFLSTFYGLGDGGNREDLGSQSSGKTRHTQKGKLEFSRIKESYDRGRNKIEEEAISNSSCGFGRLSCFLSALIL